MSTKKVIYSYSAEINEQTARKYAMSMFTVLRMYMIPLAGIFLFLMSLFFYVLAIVEDEMSSFLQNNLFFIVFGFVFIVITPLLYIRFKRIFSTMYLNQGQDTWKITLGENQLSTKSFQGESTLEYARFSKVKSNKDFIFLKMAGKSRLHLLIPYDEEAFKILQARIPVK